jgi:hypothetical protein
VEVGFNIGPYAQAPAWLYQPHPRTDSRVSQRELLAMLFLSDLQLYIKYLPFLTIGLPTVVPHCTVIHSPSTSGFRTTYQDTDRLDRTVIDSEDGPQMSMCSNARAMSRTCCGFLRRPFASSINAAASHIRDVSQVLGKQSIVRRNWSGSMLGRSGWLPSSVSNRVTVEFLFFNIRPRSSLDRDPLGL